jgi:tRNA pseudouridine32 synthase/23S rRNA pseudouridine746 synthase
MLVLDKPAGIAVHAGPGGGVTLEDGFGALRFGLPNPPSLAHRLDRDTSGCLVLGRHAKALRRLGALFAAGRVAKTYWAIVVGHPGAAEGRIASPLTKRTRGRSWQIVVDPAGAPAATAYRVLGAAGGLTWLELRPESGRTHQIRVHCRALGCPILGDPLYGEAGTGERMMLHARAIAIPLYPARDAVAVSATVPPHMLAGLAALGYDPASDIPPTREEPIVTAIPGAASPP